MQPHRFTASARAFVGSERTRRSLFRHLAGGAFGLALSRLETGQIAARQLGEKMPLAIEPAVKSVKLANGVSLPYVEQGDPAGIPVVLLHGVTDSWRSFEPVLPYLPSSLHAFTLTQRGHGDADRPTDGYRYEDLAADVAAFLDAVGLAQAVIVGTSMGSSVAQRFAIDYPDRTLGNVLMAAFAGYSHNSAVVEFAAVVATLTDPIDPSFAREFQESTLARPIPPEWLDTFVQESLKVPARVWRAVFAASLADQTAKDFDRIDSPTLIMWGDQDAFVPKSDQDALLAAIPGSRLLVYPGGGHAIHWEDPALVAADLVAFVEGLGR
jgi:pimeloyl-ACP methyl ester carboxylesterase